MTKVLAASADSAPFYLPPNIKRGAKENVTDAAGSIVANYEVWCEAADTVEDDIARHIECNIDDISFAVTPASPLGDIGKQLAPHVTHYTGTSAYAVGRREADLETAFIQVRIPCGVSNEYHLEARARAILVQRLMERMDGITIPLCITVDGEFSAEFSREFDAVTG